MRPTCCCSIFTSVVIGTAVADRVIPDGLDMIDIAPRGNGPRGSNGTPPRGPAGGSPRGAAPRSGGGGAPGGGGGACAGGTGGVWSSDGLIFGPPFPTTRLSIGSSRVSRCAFN